MSDITNTSESNEDRYAKNLEFLQNSKFSKDFKHYSQSVKTPMIGRSKKQTYWFYESELHERYRTRAKLPPEEKRQFSLFNPKKQSINYLSLILTEIVWLELPYIACRRYNERMDFFVSQFHKIIGNNDLVITEDYFKRVVAKVILRKHIYETIQNTSTKPLGYATQASDYAVAYLSYTVNKTGKVFDFKKIWDIQSVPKELHEPIETLVIEVYKFIRTKKEGYEFSGPWHKDEKCWEEVKALSIDIEIPQNFLVSK
jgi:hypothetical protein